MAQWANCRGSGYWQPILTRQTEFECRFTRPSDCRQRHMVWKSWSLMRPAQDQSKHHQRKKEWATSWNKNEGKLMQLQLDLFHQGLRQLTVDCKVERLWLLWTDSGAEKRFGCRIDFGWIWSWKCVLQPTCTVNKLLQHDWLNDRFRCQVILGRPRRVRRGWKSLRNLRKFCFCDAHHHGNEAPMAHPIKFRAGPPTRKTV